MSIANLTTTCQPATLQPPASSDHDWKEGMHLAAAVANSILFIVGITGNGIVIWLVAFKIKKTVCSLWYLNLAVADFFFCALRILNVVREAMHSHWPFGKALCKVNGSMKYFNLFASVLLLTVISVDRCLMVVNPIWCRNHRNIKRGAIICCVVWVLATAISLPYTIYLDTYRKGAGITCDYRRKLKSHIRFSLRLSRFIIGFAIPLIIIIVSNSILAIQLKGKNLKTSRNPLRLIIAVVLTFFVCWLPHHVFIFLKANKASKLTWMVGLKVSNFLAYFNSCLNPLLYFFMGYLRNQPRRQSLASVLSQVLAKDGSDLSDPDSLQMTSQNAA